MLLISPTPADFLATHLEQRQAADDVPGGADGTWVLLEELLGDDGRLLREDHARLVEGGTVPNAAANYLAGWYGGLLAQAVGFVQATAGVGLVVNESVRWRLHPGGWPDRVDVSGAKMIVPAEHPWAGRAEVEVANLDVVLRGTVDALVATLAPIVDVLRSLAKVGRVSLWAEVADGLGLATAGMPALDDGAHTIAVLQGLLDAPEAPWRSTPRMWCASSGGDGLVIGRKGGCCLAYLNAENDATDAADLDAGTDYGRFVARFPRAAGEPAYCSTCRFRAADDVEARQVFWAELKAAAHNLSAPGD